MDARIIPDNLADLYRRAAEKYGDTPAFLRRTQKEGYIPCSYRELYETGLNLATALIDMGVGAREHVGLISDNRLEWILCDCGILLCGAADVPRGTDTTAGELAYILDHADVRLAFIENLSTLEKLESRRKELPKLKAVVLMAPDATPPKGVLRLQDLIERGKSLRAEGNRAAEERMADTKPEDLFTLIYTSGTTGTPKGVQLTHANMVSQIRNLPFDLRRGERVISILPVWHSYERVFEMVAVSWGASTYYTGIRTIAEDLKTVRPHIMPSAPRLWESLYKKIRANVDQASAIRRGLFRAAYFCARHVRRAEFFFHGHTLDLEGRGPVNSLGLAIGHLLRWLALVLPHRLLDAIVLKKLRAVVGGEFRGTISGGGALQPHVDEFFNFIGIPVLEGYGMTETSPVLAVRTWQNLVIGTVGPPYPETEVRIVDLDTRDILFPDPSRRGKGRGLRGEIHVKGPQVMKGYYKNPEATDAVLNDGWMNTGDIGMMTFNNCLKILGRSKDTIVLLSGENIEPVPIEGRLVESPLIDHCMVVGQDQKHLSAILVPAEEEFRKAGLKFENAEELASNSRARELIHSEVRRLVNEESGFKSYERIVDWRIVTKPFEPGDEMTSTFKLKRHVITERYHHLIEHIYAKDK